MMALITHWRDDLRFVDLHCNVTVTNEVFLIILENDVSISYGVELKSNAEELQTGEVRIVFRFVMTPTHLPHSVDSERATARVSAHKSDPVWLLRRADSCLWFDNVDEWRRVYDFMEELDVL
jgi:hypothetical protein